MRKPPSYFHDRHSATERTQFICYPQPLARFLFPISRELDNANPLKAFSCLRATTDRRKSKPRWLPLPLYLVLFFTAVHESRPEVVLPCLFSSRSFFLFLSLPSMRPGLPCRGIRIRQFVYILQAPARRESGSRGFAAAAAAVGILSAHSLASVVCRKHRMAAARFQVCSGGVIPRRSPVCPAPSLPDSEGRYTRPQEELPAWRRRTCAVRARF